MSATATKQGPHLGPIEAGASYPLPIFQKLAGLSAWGLRRAKAAGLRVRTVGRRKFVLGDDWLAFLATLER